MRKINGTNVKKLCMSIRGDLFQKLIEVQERYQKGSARYISMIEVIERILEDGLMGQGYEKK